MKKRKIFQVILLCLIVIVSSIGLLGCGDDSDQIRKVITKFYHQDYINGYYEGRNSNLVMPDYEYISGGYVNHYLTYSKAVDAKKIEIRFSTIDVGEDYAVATYRLFVTDADGEEWTGGYVTQMIRDGGRWKLAFTKPIY